VRAGPQLALANEDRKRKRQRRQPPRIVVGH
jgi:hypothetical protein